MVSNMDAPQPRWLDKQEQESWLALANMLMRLPAALDAQLQRDAGMTHFEYQVLAGLSDASARTLRMSELAVFAGGSLSRLSHVVTRLEKRGWVTRTPDPDNGRCTLATLTEAGWVQLVANAPGHVEKVRQLVFDPLTKGQHKQLREIGLRVSRAIAEDGG